MFSVPLGPKKQSAIKEVIISLNISRIQSIHEDYTDIKIYLHQLDQFLEHSNALEKSVYTLTKLEDKNAMEFNLIVKINHIKLIENRENGDSGCKRSNWNHDAMFYEWNYG